YQVLRENNMYNVNLKNIVPSGDLTFFFSKATLDESNLWHRRLAHVNFKTLNILVKGNLVRGLPTKVFENDNSCVACKKGKQHGASCTGPTWLFDIDYLSGTMNYHPFTIGNQTNYDAEQCRGCCIDGNEHDFDVKKPESIVILSLSCSAQSKEQDDKTMKEAKGKSHVESVTGYRDLNAEFQDCSKNNSNEVTTASSVVPTIGQNSLNNTNTFSAVSISNTARLILTIWNLPFKSVLFQQQAFIKIILYHKLLEEPKRVHQALKDPSWIEAIQEELLQFMMQKVWVLVDLPYGKRAIVARIEAIRLFLAYASFMGFMVYQMDVKSTFLYGTIEEEVYVCQPPGFEDPDHLDKVYKVVKALYGLHQAPRAWYKTLATYLLENDDIIFGATIRDLCRSFEKLMKVKFPMSSIGELTFFLGLQVKQMKDGIFISQDKYVAEILRKFGLTEGKSASLSIDTEKPLLKDPDGKDVDVHIYRLMIGSLMYLTSSRLDIMFAICACAHFQVTPKASHLHAVKRMFRYLKGKLHLGLWYPKDSPFDLVAYSDIDYAGASLDRKSTTGGCQFLGCRLISLQCKKQTVVATLSTEAEYVAAASCYAQVLWIQNQLLDYR
nr:hypothetical protein [Tanacetum cinerariifolium]